MILFFENWLMVVSVSNAVIDHVLSLLIPVKVSGLKVTSKTLLLSVMDLILPILRKK